jgi:hypothetical protein
MLNARRSDNRDGPTASPSTPPAQKRRLISNTRCSGRYYAKPQVGRIRKGRMMIEEFIAAI